MEPQSIITFKHNIANNYILNAPIFNQQTRTAIFPRSYFHQAHSQMAYFPSIEVDTTAQHSTAHYILIFFFFANSAHRHLRHRVSHFIASEVTYIQERDTEFPGISVLFMQLSYPQICFAAWQQIIVHISTAHLLCYQPLPSYLFSTFIQGCIPPASRHSHTGTTTRSTGGKANSGFHLQLDQYLTIPNRPSIHNYRMKSAVNRKR
jgi:hypothetical protein